MDRLDRLDRRVRHEDPCRADPEAVDRLLVPFSGPVDLLDLEADLSGLLEDHLEDRQDQESVEGPSDRPAALAVEHRADAVP